MRRELETVLKYQDRETWNDLEEGKHWPDLAHKISPLIELNDPDEYAKRFDYLLYNIQLAQLTRDPGLETLVTKVQNTAQALFKKAKPDLPEVYSKIATIKKCMLPDFWKNPSIIHVDEFRLKLRNIIRLLDREKKKTYHTNFEDHVEERLEVADPIGLYGGKMTNYHERLESLLSAHKDHLAINKIRKFQKITDAELNSLIEIFLQDVEEDDRAGFQEYLTDRSLNLLIRTMMGLDPQAVKEAFVEIERTYRLSDIQVRFLQEIVHSVSQRGILELGDLYTGRQFKSIHDGGIEAVFEGDVVDKVFDILKKINSGVA